LTYRYQSREGSGRIGRMAGFALPIIVIIAAVMMAGVMVVAIF